MNVESLLLWSRAQFALTACYHWLFVPLTLGLGVIMAIVETIYYRNHKPEWKRWAQFWQKLFGINFAIGVATGIILEFEFGTNWSNYSWLVGDIFGAPLAIEGILAFFMEATFIAVMFFGWEKVSRRFHLASTWLTIIGATISAVWILVANAWMQDPVGSQFNPSTVRTEMTDFFAVAFSSSAINKFWHTITSCWLLGSVFALAVCAYYLLRKKNEQFAIANIKVIAPFGLIAALLTAVTGDTSAYNVAQRQPMKFAAMEALYDSGVSTPDGKVASGKGLSLCAMGVVINDGKPPRASIEIPNMLSFLATRDWNGYVPGINNLLYDGYYSTEGEKIPAVTERIERGVLAREAHRSFLAAEKNGDTREMAVQEKILKENFAHFGYGYLKSAEEAVPNVAVTFYAFRIVVGLGMLFILLFIIAIWLMRKPEKMKKARFFHILSILCLPLVYIASQSGWILAELGRQPWAIQDMLPLSAAVSKIEAHSVVVTFFIFAVLFTVLLIAEVNIMLKSIKQGPEEQVASGTK